MMTSLEPSVVNVLSVLCGRKGVLCTNTSSPKLCTYTLKRMPSSLFSVAGRSARPTKSLQVQFTAMSGNASNAMSENPFDPMRPPWQRLTGLSRGTRSDLVVLRFYEKLHLLFLLDKSHEITRAWRD